MKETITYVDVTNLIKKTKSAYKSTSYYGQVLKGNPLGSYIGVSSAEKRQNNLKASNTYIKEVLVEDENSRFVKIGVLCVDINTGNVALGNPKNGGDYYKIYNINSLILSALFFRRNEHTLPTWFNSPLFYETLLVDYRLLTKEFFYDMYTESLESKTKSLIARFNAQKKVIVGDEDEYIEELNRYFDINVLLRTLIALNSEVILLHVGYFRDVGHINRDSALLKTVTQDNICDVIEHYKLSAKVDKVKLKGLYSLMFGKNFIEAIYYYKDYLSMYAKLTKSVKNDKIEESFEALLDKGNFQSIIDLLEKSFDTFRLDLKILEQDISDKDFIREFITKYKLDILSSEYNLSLKDLINSCIKYIKVKKS